MPKRSQRTDDRWTQQGGLFLPQRGIALPTRRFVQKHGTAKECCNVGTCAVDSSLRGEYDVTVSGVGASGVADDETYPQCSQTEWSGIDLNHTYRVVQVGTLCQWDAWQTDGATCDNVGIGTACALQTYDSLIRLWVADLGGGSMRAHCYVYPSTCDAFAAGGYFETLSIGSNALDGWSGSLNQNGCMSDAFGSATFSVANV